MWSLPASGPISLAEQALDRHVDVLVGRVELEAVGADPLLDPVEAGDHLLELGLVEDADPLQGARVGARLVEVVGGQRASRSRASD